jgi:hypothetical protein
MAAKETAITTTAKAGSFMWGIKWRKKVKKQKEFAKEKGVGGR